MSAFVRAYHSKYDTPKIFDDFLAKDLITGQEWANIQENLIKGISFFDTDIAKRLQGQPVEAIKWITQVQLSPTPLARAAYCEKLLLHEMQLGAKQYVILGAGLDSFCFRHPEYSGCLDIFEVDSPASQAFKTKRLLDAGFQIPEHLHFVPMDFTETFSVQCLIENGFTPDQKTFCSLLGVSYYLTKEELSGLLRQLFKNLPAGSSIVFDYPDEHLYETKGKSDRVQHMVQMAEAGGEPMKSCFSYAEMEKMLEEAGLLIYEHLTPDLIQQQFFRGRTDNLSAFETIHYIHAVKK